MNNSFFKTILWAWAAVIVTVAFSKDNDEPTQAPDNETPRLRMLTINDAAITRATLGDAGSSLSASWTAGDKITVRNLSIEDDIFKATLEKKDGNTFSGEKLFCMERHNLAVVYPTADIDFYKKYTITLSGQNGTLETLANTYHYLYGLATVTNTTNTTAIASMTQAMQPLLCICRFSFYTGDDNTNLLTVKSLDISFNEQGEGGNADTYPQTATVTLGLTNDGSTPPNYSMSASITPDSGSSPLHIDLANPSENVYVALLPIPFDSSAGKRSYKFNVTDNSGKTYTDNAQAKLRAGKFFTATLKVQPL